MLKKLIKLCYENTTPAMTLGHIELAAQGTDCTNSLDRGGGGVSPVI